MSDPNIEVKFTARTGEVEAGAQKAAAAIQEAVGQMRAQFEGLQATVKGAMAAVSGAMLAVTAVIGGGAIFKEFVSSAMETTKEAVQLGKALGITATEASYLRSAAAQVGIGMDTLMAAGTRLTRTLLTNEDAVKNLGVATRDAQGHFRNTNDVMQDVNARLREFKEGTDRNIEGMKIYGRGWAEVAPLVQKFKGVTEESRREAEALNLVVGQEAVSAMANYRTAQLGVGEVMEGVKNTIGQALLPGLTDLANWFRSIGPAVIQIATIAMNGYLVIQHAVGDAVKALWSVLSAVFSNIAALAGQVFGSGGKAPTAMDFFRTLVETVGAMFIGFRISVEEACNLIAGSLEQLANVGSLVGRVLYAALVEHSWSDVKAAWQDYKVSVTTTMQKTMDEAVKIAEKGAADIAKVTSGALGVTTKQTAIKTKEGGERSDGKDAKDPKDKNRVGTWDAINKAAKDRYELENGLKKRDLADDVSYWQSKLAVANKENGELEKVQLKLVEAKLAIMKRDVEQGRAVSEEQVNESEKAALSTIAIQKDEADRRYQLGLLTKSEMLAIEKDFEAQKLSIEKAAQDARVAMVASDPNHTPAALQKEKDKLLEIERKYQQAVAQLQTKVAVENNKYMAQFQSGMEQGLSSVLQKFASGTMTIKSLFANMGKTILSSMTQVFADMAAKWLAKEVAQTAATAAGVAMRTGLEAAGAAESVLIWAAAAVKNILSSAWEAMAGAYKAIVGIPYVGPFLAPVAAGTAFAAVAGFASNVSSARNGYDIPAGVNPLTQLHEREMVLPAPQADVVRSMAENGGGGGGSVHVTTQKLSNGMHLVSEGDLVKLLKRADRNFSFASLRR